jgi:hypothetical protein
MITIATPNGTSEKEGFNSFPPNPNSLRSNLKFNIEFRLQKQEEHTLMNNNKKRQ